MEKRQVILIIDADRQLIRAESAVLAKEPFEVKPAFSAREGKSLIDQAMPGLLITETELPDADGLELIRSLRSYSALPVIAVSSKAEVPEKVLALAMGADDYLVKPFDLRELAARVKALLRRSGMPAAGVPAPASRTVEYPGLSVSLDHYSVLCRGVQIPMPPKEIELLYHLASSPNQVFTREQLLSHIWGYDYVGDTRTVDVHVKRLRKKLSPSPAWSLTTVWGIGYKFEVR